MQDETEIGYWRSSKKPQFVEPAHVSGHVIGRRLDHWIIEALDEIDAAELGERIIAWARENQGGSVTLRSKVFERARYDALGEKAGV